MAKLLAESAKIAVLFITLVLEDVSALFLQGLLRGLMEVSR